MTTTEILTQTLEHFKQQRQKKLDELLTELGALDTTIRQIQMQLGQAPDSSDLASLGLPLLAESLKPQSSQGQTGTFLPSPDEFFNTSQSDAAKAFLKRIGHAVALDELVTGLKSGGCKVGGIRSKNERSIFRS